MFQIKILNEFATMVQRRLDSCREESRWRTAGAVPHPKGNYETAGVMKAPPAGLECSQRGSLKQ